MNGIRNESQGEGRCNNTVHSDSPIGTDLAPLAVLNRLICLALKLLLRHRLRTTIILLTLVFSQVVLVLTFGISRGSEWMVLGQVCEKSTGHIQIQNKNFIKTRKVDDFLEHPVPLDQLRGIDGGVDRVLLRTFSFGFLERDGETQLAAVRGLEPVKDFTLNIVAGQRLPDKAAEFPPYPILIGKEMASSLMLEPGDNCMWNFIPAGGRLDDVQCEVVGVIQEGSPERDRHSMVIHIDTAREILDLGSGCHEEILFLQDPRHADQTAARLQQALGDSIAVLPWRSFNPQLRRVLRIIASQMMVVVFLVIGVSLFGIASTLGMSVSERVRELGLLKALGIGPRRMATYVLCEGLLLGLVTAVVSSVAAVGFIILFTWTGINLTPLAGESIILDGIRIDMHLKPVSEFGDFMLATVLVLATATLASLIPAWRAARLDPAVALRITD